MRNKILVFILAVMIFPVYGAQKFTVKEGEAITAYISKVGLNRIVVTGDRIISITGLANQFYLEKDLKLGQIYVKPASLLDDPIHLYLTTEKGYTFALSLLLHDMAPESIILEPPQLQKTIPPPRSFEMQVVDLIKAMHHQGPHKELAQRYRLKAESYRFVNLSRMTRTLKEEDFYSPGVVAISIACKKLAPHASTDIYFLRSSNG